jgi:hypothetical protein
MRSRLLTILAVTGIAAALAVAPATADDAEDEALAEEALPTLDDLPDGYEEDPADEDSGPSGLPECKGIDAVVKTAEKQPNAESPNFVDGDDATAQVEARIFVYSSAKGAKKYFKAWNADAAEDCLLALGEMAAEEQAADADVVVQTLGLEGIGDDVVGRSLILRTSQGEVFLDLYVARTGRAIVGLATQYRGGSFPSGIDLLEDMVSRVEEGL